MKQDDDNFFAVPSAYPGGGTTDLANPLVHIVERYWNRLRANVWATLSIIVACVILAIVATMLATPYYSAEARIEITREQANVTNVEGIESEASNKDVEFYQTQYALLEARSVAEGVARALGVISDDRLFDEFQVDIDAAVEARTNVPEAPSAAVARLDVAADLLMDNVSISPVRGSRLVDVGFDSPSADLSATVANEWVSRFQAAAIERRFQSSSEAREFLEEQLAELRQRLEDSQRQLVSFAADREIIPLTDNRDGDGNTDTLETLVSKNLGSLNDALTEATRDRIAAESRMRLASNTSDAALQNPALNGMRETRAEVSAELARMTAIFEDEYPAVQGLQSQIAELDSAIAAEEGRIRESARTGFREALARERELERQVQSLKSQTLDERRDSIQFAIYQREVDTNRELYEGLLQRYKEIGVAGVGASNITVVDTAKVPLAPSSPSLPLNLALGLLAGIGLAGGFVFLREQLDQSLRDPADVENALGLPLLGAIPEEREEDIEAKLEDVKSIAAEAYFAASSNIAFLTSHGAPKSMAITSTRPNEGKSTSAYALGLALVRSGKSVLLVDADLRNASQHSFFEAENKFGLANLLAGDTSRGDKPYMDTKWEGLSLLTSGPLPPEPGTLLSGTKLKDLVKNFETEFDHVIVDAPPMLGLADAPLLSRAVEGVIYTIEANGLKLKAVRSGIQRLRSVDATIFGAIVTKLNSTNSAYGYGEYGYGYEYASSER